MRYVVRQTSGAGTHLYAALAEMTRDISKAMLVSRDDGEELRSAMELLVEGEWDLIPEDEWEVEHVVPGGGLSIDWAEEVWRKLG